MVSEMDKLIANINHGFDIAVATGVVPRNAAETLSGREYSDIGFRTWAAHTNAFAREEAQRGQAAARWQARREREMAKSAAAWDEINRGLRANAAAAARESQEAAKVKAEAAATRKAMEQRQRAAKERQERIAATFAQRAELRRRADAIADQALRDCGAGKITPQQRDRVLKIAQLADDATRAKDRAAEAEAKIEAGADADAVQRLRAVMRAAGLEYVAAMKRINALKAEGKH